MTALDSQAVEPAHVRMIREQLDQVEKTIRNPAAGLASSETTPLLEQKAAADEALKHYSRLLQALSLAAAQVASRRTCNCQCFKRELVPCL